MKLIYTFTKNLFNGNNREQSREKDNRTEFLRNACVGESKHNHSLLPPPKTFITNLILQFYIEVLEHAAAQ